MNEIKCTERAIPTQEEVEEAAERLEPEIEHWERAGYFVPDNEDQFGLDIVILKRAAIEGVREVPQTELFDVDDEEGQTTCTWKYASEDVFDSTIRTQCGNFDEITVDGTPDGRNYEFCPYCSKPLEWKD